MIGLRKAVLSAAVLRYLPDVPEQGAITAGGYIGAWHSEDGPVGKLWVACVTRDGSIVSTDPARPIGSSLAVAELESAEAALAWIEEALGNLVQAGTPARGVA